MVRDSGRPRLVVATLAVYREGGDDTAGVVIIGHLRPSERTP
jgi:hypothetical protein